MRWTAGRQWLSSFDSTYFALKDLQIKCKAAGQLRKPENYVKNAVFWNLSMDAETPAEIAELIAQTTITLNPFVKKYSKVGDAASKTCSSVLNPIDVRELMETGWG